MKTALLSILFLFTVQQPAAFREVTLAELNDLVQKDGDTLYVVNFWATWCRPCVNEMPYFEQAAKTFANQKVKVIFVSLDFLSEKERLASFITRKKIQPQVFLLTEKNPNVWINKVDSTWSGTIPATVFYKNKKKIFFREGEFGKDELDSIIKQKNN